MDRELPQIQHMRYGNNASNALVVGRATPLKTTEEWQRDFSTVISKAADKLAHRQQTLEYQRVFDQLHQLDRKEENDMANKDTWTRRFVRVLIVDPDENVPPDHALLYDSGEVFTDKTDQELYFDAGINEKLGIHNDYRRRKQDKDATKKTGEKTFLEPVRIRDLRMTVITIAEF